MNSHIGLGRSASILLYHTCAPVLPSPTDREVVTVTLSKCVSSTYDVQIVRGSEDAAALEPKKCVESHNPPPRRSRCPLWNGASRSRGQERPPAQQRSGFSPFPKNKTGRDTAHGMEFNTDIKQNSCRRSAALMNTTVHWVKFCTRLEFQYRQTGTKVTRTSEWVYPLQ